MKNFRVTREGLALLDRLPRKYYDRFYMLEAEDGLIDDCKYMLYFDNGYTFNGYDSVPVKSISEAIRFIKETTWTDSYTK